MGFVPVRQRNSEYVKYGSKLREIWNLGVKLTKKYNLVHEKYIEVHQDQKYVTCRRMSNKLNWDKDTFIHPI